MRIILMGMIALLASGCAWWRTHEALLVADVAMCGEMLAGGALAGLQSEVIDVAERAADGTIGAVPLPDRLHQLEATEIRSGVIAGAKCIAMICSDAVKAQPSPAPSPQQTAAKAGLSPGARARLAAWLAQQPRLAAP